MNNVECESCVKRKTIYCPNSSECYETENKPYWQNRIMLLEENKELRQDKYELILDSNGLINANEMLQQKNQQLHNKIDKLVDKINFYQTTEWGLRGYDILETFKKILKDSDVDE